MSYQRYEFTNAEDYEEYLETGELPERYTTDWQEMGFEKIEHYEQWKENHEIPEGYVKCGDIFIYVG